MTEPLSTLSLRPATPGDRFMVRRWLAEPGAEEQWGSRASAEAEITLAMESPSALCRIVERGGTPVGYVHAVDAGLWGEALPPEIPPGCWDIDLLVSAAALPQVAPGEVLHLIVREVFETTLAMACCILVSITNEAVVRTYEQAGFRWLRVWTDPSLGPCWVLLLDRPRR
jgi:RimJ/RimL family protein N-acetyltransferase